MRPHRQGHGSPRYDSDQNISPRRAISDHGDSSNKNNQGYALKEYLKTPHRHETWDWEKKAKDRNDKSTRL
ncbi:hypothetical protein V8C34DRAFT_287941 [Trichoderma compactum]